MKMDLEAIQAAISAHGPNRVVVNLSGEAIPATRATGLGYKSDIIFIRDDGWSLGAPKTFGRKAFEMWDGSWIGFIRPPSTKIQPMSEYK